MRIGTAMAAAMLRPETAEPRRRSPFGVAQRPTVVDVARAVDRRVADVADTAEEEVRDDPGHDEADQRGRDEARAAACRERAVVPRPAKAEEGQPHAQVEQWRVNERHADERPVVVEERDRGAE